MATLDTIAHDHAMQASVGAIATHLQRLLGQKLTAYMLGLSEARVIGGYARGEESPEPDVEERLRLVFQIVKLLEQVESADTIRAWFMGMNPTLDDASPARMIREDSGRVLQAARRFLADG